MDVRAAFAALPFAARAALCAAATAGIDMCYALYTLRTAAHRAAAAATYGCLVYLLGAVNIIGYTDDLRLLGPILVGG